MRVGWLSAVLVLASSPALAQDPAQVIVMQERVPFAFLLGTPTGEVGRTSSSELIRIVSNLARRYTDFDVQILDPGLMTECRGRLGCLTLKTRRDYQRSDLLDDRNRPIPYREHVRRLRQSGQIYPRYLLVVSNVTLSGQADRMSAVLVNTDLALAVLHEAPRDQADWEDAAEARLNSGAVVAAPARAQVSSPDEAETFLTKLFTDDFLRAFKSTGNWEPYGTLDLTTSVSGATILLDDKPLGVTQAGLTRVEKVRPGQHALRLEHPDRLPYTSEVRVQRGETTLISPELATRPNVRSDLPRQLTLWTGVAVAAAGVGLVAYGATRPDPGLRTSCFEGTDGCQDGKRFVSFGYDPSQASTAPTAVNPSGVAVVPLGYSLAGAGAAWGAGALLTEANELPWIPWLIGAVVGATAYGVSAAVAGP
ncbi:MAG: PEGA domain-containing protein [Myxococcales bacterium]|nr:PEGA domain-containing protein [Myxococcales bacterium]MCB9645221.1 PEGA domain-containing protein [Deltaproteobacteria bacterium]